MEKIRTIFKREGRFVVPEWEIEPILLLYSTPTEKLDGTNVRLTIRDGVLMRVEARMNPTKALKHIGIIEPWYRDAWVYGQEAVAPQDRYIQEAALNTDLLSMSDGEFSAEAVGPKIQGNPLGLAEHTCYFVDSEHPSVPKLMDVPPMSAADPARWAKQLGEYLREARSAINPEVGIEGIVWHYADGYAGKIKGKDFDQEVVG